MALPQRVELHSDNPNNQAWGQLQAQLQSLRDSISRNGLAFLRVTSTNYSVTLVNEHEPSRRAAIVYDPATSAVRVDGATCFELTAHYDRGRSFPATFINRQGNSFSAGDVARMISNHL